MQKNTSLLCRICTKQEVQGIIRRVRDTQCKTLKHMRKLENFRILSIPNVYC